MHANFRARPPDRLKTYLYSWFCQPNSKSQLLPHENIRVMRLSETSLQFIQLGRGEPGPVPLLFGGFVPVSRGQVRVLVVEYGAFLFDIRTNVMMQVCFHIWKYSVERIIWCFGFVRKAANAFSRIMGIWNLLQLISMCTRCFRYFWKIIAGSPSHNFFVVKKFFKNVTIQLLDFISIN